MQLAGVQGGAYLIYKPVLEALRLWHQLLCAAVPVARWSGVSNEVPVIDLKDDRLNKACTINIAISCCRSLHLSLAKMRPPGLLATKETITAAEVLSEEG